MKPEVIDTLLSLNHQFYTEFAQPFAQSRIRPFAGFYRLIEFLPNPTRYLLDVGCGDGRLGRFLIARQLIQWYTGVDFSRALLEQAAVMTMGDFHERDLAQPDALYGLGEYDAIVCIATMQHIPGWQTRKNLLLDMKAHLTENGRIILANWQFPHNPRMQRKILPWETIGLTADDVEPGDYLLHWKRGGEGLRYVCHIDDRQTAELAAATGLEIQDQFLSDGKEGDLNLYTVLTKPH
ncbi:MAG: class I SAM-dependent methyltransferase [Chloroflexi bacterium]|nr:MAG: class I SAM-dependent methyltransferase [Chloroflexota bacterium]